MVPARKAAGAPPGVPEWPAPRRGRSALEA